MAGGQQATMNTGRMFAQLSTTSISEAVANGTVTLSGSCTCNVYSNLGSATYSWTRVSGDASVTALSSTSATTQFQSVGTNVERTADFKCTVTDSLGAVDSDIVTITATHGTP
jgi:hypothetical protein